ncbi:MAG: hypothetical protein ACI4U4_01160 [Bacilli bacterium]
MKKDDIRTFITIIIICTLIVGIVLILNRKSNSEKLEVVNEYNTFFTTSGYVNNYLNYSSDSSKLYDLLYSDYIDKNNITVDNILTNIKSYPKNSTIKVTEMKYVKVKNDYIYYIKGKIYQNTFDGKELIDDNFDVVAVLDFDTLSYAIYPIENDNYKEVIDKIKKIEIENNKYNSIKKSELITKEQICVIYLSDYIDKIYNDIDLSYKILSKSMKEKYTTLEEYKNYINNNIDKITTEADKCSLEKIDNNRLYTVIDKNKNKYIFNEERIMNYEVDFYLYDNNTENK